MSPRLRGGSSGSTTDQRLASYHQAVSSGAIGRVHAWRGDSALPSSSPPPAFNAIAHSGTAADGGWNDGSSDASYDTFYIPIADTRPGAGHATAGAAPQASTSVGAASFRANASANFASSSPRLQTSLNMSNSLPRSNANSASGRHISFAPSPPPLTREPGARPMQRRASSPSPMANARPFSGAQGMTRAHSPGPGGSASLSRALSAGGRPPPVSGSGRALGSVGMGRRASSPGPGARPQLLGALRRTVGFEVPTQPATGALQRGRSPSPGASGRRGSLGLGGGQLSPGPSSSGMLSRTSSATSGATARTGVTSVGEWSLETQREFDERIAQREATEAYNRRLIEDPRNWYGSLETDLRNVDALRRQGYNPDTLTANRTMNNISQNAGWDAPGWDAPPPDDGGAGRQATLGGRGWR